MWCDNCKKEVDINSVAVKQPNRAITYDAEGDFSPTVIGSSSTDIINVCKSCGESKWLWVSLDERNRKVKARNRRAKQQDKALARGCLIVIGLAVLITLYLFISWLNYAN